MRVIWTLILATLQVKQLCKVVQRAAVLMQRLLTRWRTACANSMAASPRHALLALVRQEALLPVLQQRAEAVRGPDQAAQRVPVGGPRRRRSLLRLRRRLRPVHLEEPGGRRHLLAPQLLQHPPTQL